MKLLRYFRNSVLPAGIKYRRFRLGLPAGCTIPIDLRKHLRLYLGLYERELIPHLKALVKPGYKCFDIGSREGYDALILAKLCKSEVISFECDEVASAELRETFARNRFPIRTVTAFVGNKDGENEISIDSASVKYFPPQFIKLDIEGAEDQALEGAKMTLGTYRPSLIVEVHSIERESQCLKILKSFGYAPIVVDQSPYFREHRPIAHNRWLVCQSPVQHGR